MCRINKQSFAALKPGGVYVVLIRGMAGSGVGATETLHRMIGKSEDGCAGSGL